MGDRTESPSRPAQPDSDSEESDEESEIVSIYSVEELAGIIQDFYTFLTTLHFDPAGLKIPPPGGWPGLPPDSYSEFKTDFAVEVMRNLPYFASKAAVHYKSGLIDYTTIDPDFFRNKDEGHENQEELWSSEGELDASHVFCLAWGHESYGRDILLDTLHGEIIQDVIRVQMLPAEDIQSYFENLKQEYRSLNLIPCIGKVTIEAHRVEERDELISDADVLAQTSSHQTDLDVQYIRQIYRQHGWPDAFRRVEAMEVVKKFSDLLEEVGRDGWESDDLDLPYHSASAS